MARTKRMDYYVLDRRLAEYNLDFVPQTRLDKAIHFEHAVVRIDDDSSKLIVHNQCYASATNGYAKVYVESTPSADKYIKAFFNAEKVDGYADAPQPKFVGMNAAPVELFDFRCTGMGKDARQARKNNAAVLAKECISETNEMVLSDKTVTVEYINRVWAYLYGLHVESGSETVRVMFTYITNFMKANSLFLDRNQFYKSATSVYNGVPIEQRMPKQKRFDMWPLTKEQRQELEDVLAHCLILLAESVKPVQWMNGWLFVNGVRFVRLSGQDTNVKAVVAAMEKVYDGLDLI